MKQSHRGHSNIMTFVRRVSIESIFIFFALQLMLNISTSGKEAVLNKKKLFKSNKSNGVDLECHLPALIAPFYKCVLKIKCHVSFGKKKLRP